MKIKELQELGYKMKLYFQNPSIEIVKKNRGMKTILVLIKDQKIFVVCSNMVGLKGEFTEPVESRNHFQKVGS